MSDRQPSFLELPNRGVVFALAMVAGAVFITVMTYALPENAARILLDRGGTLFPYPLTIQNVSIMIFFAGLGEAFVRWRVALREQEFAGRAYLPEDEATVLQAADLGPIKQRLAGKFDHEHGFLPYLINLCILQFHASRSVDQTVSVLNSSMELIAHRVDLRYTSLRYVAWVIPTIGFIGTVVGIAATLAAADPDNLDLRALTSSLAVAFNTTLVALALSAILVFVHQTVQRMEEQSVNRAGDYCLRNLINRLYTAGQ